MDGKALEVMGELTLCCSSVVRRSLVRSGLLGVGTEGSSSAFWQLSPQ